MKLKVLVRAEAAGGYSVSVPALRGCYSEGETLDEALTNIKEAAELWLEVTEEAAQTGLDGQAPPLQLQEIEL